MDLFKKKNYVIVPLFIEFLIKPLFGKSFAKHQRTQGGLALTLGP